MHVRPVVISRLRVKYLVHNVHEHSVTSSKVTLHHTRPSCRLSLSGNIRHLAYRVKGTDQFVFDILRIIELE